MVRRISFIYEANDNVSSNGVCADRKEAILQKQREKKQLTLERGKKYNLQHINNSPNYGQSVKYPNP